MKAVLPAAALATLAAVPASGRPVDQVEHIVIFMQVDISAVEMQN
jgi:hypothetical protein